MISRIGARLRALRRIFNRTHLSARILRKPVAKGSTEDTGLILIQIDGLSRNQLEQAIRSGRFPFLSKLIERRHFSLETFYSGIPSTTPAVQGELFFGSRCAVPAFQFYRRSAGRDFSMYEASSADEIEADLTAGCDRPLLKGAHAYSNIFRAGASKTRYCSHDMDVDVIFRRLGIFKFLVLAAIYLPRLLRIAALGLIEVLLALMDAVSGFMARENVITELLFVPARVAVCVVMREAIRFRMLLDIEAGTKVIHANFLGYDEQSHRRGPGSAFAHWTLKGIDRTIRDVYQAARFSAFRDYELIVYSDHGQEHAVPYHKRHGRELQGALEEVFSNGPTAGKEVWMRRVPSILGKSLDRLGRTFGLRDRNEVTPGGPDGDEQIVVTAMGPLGHIYFPMKLSEQQLDSYAEALVKEAGIPLVIVPSADGSPRTFGNHGQGRLPADAISVLGEHHPFLNEAAEDLVLLANHPDAGDLIISGWDPANPPLTFPMENGAHGGPGSEETRGFVLLPDRIRHWHLAHLPQTRTRIRGEDLRSICLHYLQADQELQAGEQLRETDHLRVMTYNIHSCVGTDGKLRPERIARVINAFDPDIIAVQEVDCHRLRSGGSDQAGLIAGYLRMTHVFQALLEEKGESYGIAIFSRHPFEIMRTDALTPSRPRRFAEARGAIWVKLPVRGGPPIHFVCTHFGLTREERRRQMAELMSPSWLGGLLAQEPVILCGDFNAGRSSKLFEPLHPRLRPVRLENGGNTATFPSIKPAMHLDHTFVSRHFKVNTVSVPDTPTARVASDHLPLCVELSMTADP